MKTLKTLLVAAMATTALSASAFAQEFTLKLHHFLGPKSPAQTQMLEPWARSVEEGTGGRVKIEIYPGGFYEVKGAAASTATVTITDPGTGDTQTVAVTVTA